MGGLNHGKVDVGMNRLKLDVMRNQMEDVHGHLMSAWIIRHQIVYCLVLHVCSVMSHAMIIINAAQKFVELMECVDDLFFSFFLSFDLFFFFNLVVLVFDTSVCLIPLFFSL